MLRSLRHQEPLVTVIPSNDDLAIRRSSRTRLLAGLIMTMLVILLGLTLVTRLNFVRLRRLTTRSDETLAAIESVRAHLLEAETGQRGFLLTGAPEYLSPYQHAIRELPHSLASLQQLTGDDREQHRLAERLALLTDQKLAELREIIEIFQRRDSDRALALVRTDVGRNLMSESIATLDRLRAELIARRREQLGSATRLNNLSIILVVGSAMMVSIAIGFLMSLTRDLRRHQDLTETILSERERLVKAEELARAARIDAETAREKDARRARHGLAITEVALMLNSGAELRAMLLYACQSAVKYFGAAFARVWTTSADGTMLELQASAGQYTHLDGEHGRIPVGKFKIGKIAEERKAHITNDVANDPLIGDPAWASREALTAFAGYPIIVEDRCVGVFALFSRESLATDDHDALDLFANTLAMGVERRTIEREREKLVQELARSNRELDQFGYVVSHDLKAPLRGIATLSEWIQEEVDPHLSDEGRKQMQLLRARVMRVTALIDGILDYARVNRTDSPLETIDLNTLVREVVELIAIPQSVRVEIAPELPTLHTGRIAIQQVLLNLIGNAVKHTGRNDPTIEIDVVDAGTFYEFRITDNGNGIAPEFHDQIWGLFQTLENRDKVEGNGIGLSVVKKIVEARGGRAWVESSSGKGASFRFLWPKREQQRGPVSGLKNDA